MNEKHIIGVDIGGTKIAAGLVAISEPGSRPSPLESQASVPPLGPLPNIEPRRPNRPTARVIERIILPTHADEPGQVVLGQIYKAIDSLLQRGSRSPTSEIGPGSDFELRASDFALEGIGIVAPGPIEPQRGEIIYAPNIPSLRNIPLAHIVKERYGLPSLAENDANAAGLAEALFGAGVGHRYVFYVTVSTGIGTGLVIDGQIYGGKDGMAVEAGHVTIDHHGPVCNCGRRGCIEAFASGTAITRRTREKLMRVPCPEMRTGVDSTSRILELADGSLDKITPIIVSRAAREGDQLARDIIVETARHLSVWLGGMINIFDPNIIVIGGGVSLIGDMLFDVIRKETPKHSIIPKAADVLIVPAKLENDVGILGAAALFVQNKA
jgi:glucokinase